MGSVPVLIRAKRAEITELRNLQLKYRSDWPAVFSCNYHGQIWPFVTYGYTPFDEREFVSTPLSELIAGIYLQVRPPSYEEPGGGRFFVNPSGAYFQAGGDPLVQFVEFDHTDDHDPQRILPPVVRALEISFGKHLRCVGLRGSLSRGDPIGYFSDANFVAYVAKASGQPLERLRHLEAEINPAQHMLGGVQVTLFDEDTYHPVIPPIRVVFRTLSGRLPKYVSTSEDLNGSIEEATSYLKTLPGQISRLDKLEGDPYRVIREFNRLIMESLYAFAVLLTRDGFASAMLTRKKLVEQVGPVCGNLGGLERFYETASRWSRMEPTVQEMEAMRRIGSALVEGFLDGAADLLGLGGLRPLKQRSEEHSSPRAAFGPSQSTYPWTD